jgi:hypothetical protein
LFAHSVDGQVKHLDISCTSAENHVVVALPVQLDSDNALSWEAVGTSVVIGCQFSWNSAPQVNLDLCKVCDLYSWL